MGTRGGMLSRCSRARVLVVAAYATICLCAAGARADVLEEAWKRGNDAFLRGDYQSAVSAYEQIERQGVAAPDLHYNLGNAYYRQGQLGRAIWAWERALALDPEGEDARYNLSKARKAVERRIHDKLEGAARDPLWIRLVTGVPLSIETWLFAGSYLAFFTALVLRVRARRVSKTDDGMTWAALAAVFGATAALAGALLVGRSVLDRLPFAIVLPDAVQVKEGADPNYRTTFDVHAGLRVRLVDRDQDWVRIRLANGLDGWVRDRDVGRL